MRAFVNGIEDIKQVTKRSDILYHSLKLRMSQILKVANISPALISYGN